MRTLVKFAVGEETLSVRATVKDEEEWRKSMETHTHTLSLPPELVIEILLRLRVDSLLQCKRVCKAWLFLISDPQFCIYHYDLAVAPSHDKLLLIANDFYAESIVIDSPLLMGALRLILPPTSPSYLDQYDDVDYRRKLEIVGSCRGLILLYHDRSGDLILWNPSIGVHRIAPMFNVGLTHVYLYGFGYDTSSDDYLLILIGLLDEYNYYYDDESENDKCKVVYQIFSFNADKWEMNNISFMYKSLSHKSRAGSLFNVHWLVFSRDKKVIVILAFDLIRRRFSEIPLFDHFTMEKYELCGLMVMGGCLSVCCSVRGCATHEIWAMKEYKVDSCWTKSTVIPNHRFFPICITKDGGIIGSNITGSGRLEKLYDKGELLEHFIYGGGEWLHSVNLQSAMYRESLLSPSNGIRETLYNRWKTRKCDSWDTNEDDQW